MNLLFFGDALFSDLTFFARDVSTFHYPLKRLVTESYRHGEWPLWNPYIQMGQPLLANPNSMALYPTQILFQWLPFEVAFELHFVLHCILAGVSAFCLARKLGLSQRAAFLAAGVYNFSGITLSCVNLFNILPVVAFLPLLPLLLLRVINLPNPSSLTLAGIVLACFFLLLEPLSSLATGLFLIGVYVGARGQTLKAPSRLKAPAALLLVVTLGLLLAAAQWIPTLELMRDSGRSGGLTLEAATFWSLHPITLLQTICPRIFGEYFRLNAPVPWASRFFDNREPYFLSCYFGTVPLLLAACAGCFRRDRVSLLLSCVGASALLLSFGRYTPLYSWLFEWLPVFRYGRYPIKFMLTVNLCLALLAGSGLEYLEASFRRFRKTRAGRFRILIPATLLVAALLLSIGLYFDQVWNLTGLARVEGQEVSFRVGGEELKVSRSLIHDGLRHVQIQFVLFAIVLLLVGWKKIRPAFWGIGVLAFVVFDLVTSNIWLNPLTRSDFYEAAPVSEYLLRQSQIQEPFRVFRFEPARLKDHPAILYRTDSAVWLSFYRKLTLYPFLAAKDHIQYAVFPSIDKLETLPVQNVIQAVHRTQSKEERLKVLTDLNVKYVLSPTEMDSPLLKLDALFQVNSDEPLRLYQLTSSLPRGLLVEPEDRGAFAWQSDGRLVSSPEARDNQLRPFQVSASPQVQFTEYSATRVEIAVRTDRPQDLVLLDSYFPGWQARVDGRETEVRQYRDLYRAVRVSPGRHRVSFNYMPQSFRFGLWISSLTALVWMLALGAYGFIQKASQREKGTVPSPG